MGFQVFWDFKEQQVKKLKANPTGLSWLAIDWNNFIKSIIKSNDSIAVSMVYLEKLVDAISKSGFRLCIIRDGSYQDYDRQITRLGRMAENLKETFNPKQWDKAKIESETLKWKLSSAGKVLFENKFEKQKRGWLGEDGNLDDLNAEFIFQKSQGEADSLIRKFARRVADACEEFVVISEDAALVLGVPEKTSICTPKCLSLCNGFINTLDRTSVVCVFQKMEALDPLLFWTPLSRLDFHDLVLVDALLSEAHDLLIIAEELFKMPREDSS